jgi:3,4-dihydroxy 2-butanone 4-phosphate synthase/GTP cyclohydrolase II
MSGNQLNEAEQLRLDNIEGAIEDIRNGKIVIVVDDEDRENEGDFICAAECVTPEIINFMATHGRGLICAPLDERKADALDLQMMVSSNTALHETAFTVTIDLIGHGCTTGISAYDRAIGIRHLVHPDARPSDYARPGHIFPLRAKQGGVLRRTGHTEAAIDLARLAGFYPAGVLVEILNEDGSMARLPQLFEIAARFDMKIIAIKDLVAYRMRTERLVKRELSVSLPTRFGEIEVIAYSQITSGDVHLAIRKGVWQENEAVPVRVHSSSEGAELLELLLQEHNNSFGKALERIAGEGKGLLLMMFHGGREENTLLDKLRHLEKSLKTSELPFRTEMSQRDFGIGAQILRDLGIKRMRLITNSPKKRVGLEGYGLEVVDHIPF